MKDRRTHGLLRPARKEYILEDTTEPNLLRDQFQYDSVPQLVFDGVSVPMALPQDYFITDTTFRDGQQARPPYEVQQVVTIYEMLHRLGGPNGVIRQCEFFLYSDKDKEAVEKCLAQDFEFPEVTGWIRAHPRDFQLVKEMGLSETGILTSASDYHIFLKLNKNRTEAMDDYLDIVRSALDAGIKPRCHLEDITRADFYGFIIPFVQELMELAEDSGVPIKVRACDTMGYGVPWPEASLPRSVPKLIHALIHDGGVPSEQLEWHGHNDFHKVLVNPVTAWLYGCSGANGTLLGFGERTGNSPVEGLVMDYISLNGDSCGVDTRVITEIGEYFANQIGHVVPPNYPFVGVDFNTTRAGIHADGLLKDEEIYNIFDTDALLNRPLRVSVTDKSGLAGIVHWLDGYFNLAEDHKIDKRHPGIIRIWNWVEEQYAQNRTTSISDAEMVEQVRLHLPEFF